MISPSLHNILIVVITLEACFLTRCARLNSESFGIAAC